MIASLTRHLVSSASSTIAGNKLWDNWAIPITCRKRKKLRVVHTKYHKLLDYS